MDARLEPVAFERIEGFAADDHDEAFKAFLRWAAKLVRGDLGPRLARPPSPALVGAARDALDADISGPGAARNFFETRFRAFRVAPADGRGFLTGYYEPIVEASAIETPEFAWPILARPADLVSFANESAPAGLGPGITGARRRTGGGFEPYPARAEIEQARRDPIVWLRDAVEVFLIQVQGSARVVFPDGRAARLAYDGRNGRPYNSIGRILIEAGEIAEREMSLKRLKAWLREAGLGEGEAGLALMRRNPSFVFFRLVTGFDAQVGPTAGAGVALTPLRSIAIDRTIWSYGTPFFLDAELPWRDERLEPFRRLTIAQDTGSAILGPARADLFFGSGDAAGARAGAIRHAGDFVVLLPAEDAR